jgi:hypothetical protein
MKSVVDIRREIVIAKSVSFGMGIFIAEEG